MYSYKLSSGVIATMLTIVLLFICRLGFGETEMIISRVGTSQVLTYPYEVAATLGDSLTLYDYAVSGNTVSLKRGIVTANGSVLPQQTIYSFTAPVEWGAFNMYPLYFKHKNGKLYSAFTTNVKFIVLFTGAEETTLHVFDRTGILISKDPLFSIVDENMGFLNMYNYPNSGDASISIMDFTTDTLQLFYSVLPTQYGYPYSFYELHSGYFLMTCAPMGTSPDLLVHGTSIINTYPNHWYQAMPYYMFGSVEAITDQCSSLFVSDGLERNQSWQYVLWVENNNLESVLVPCEGGHHFYGVMLDFIPHTGSTFSCIKATGYQDVSNSRDADDGFGNWELVNGQLIRLPGFPDLSEYQNARRLFRMDQDYTVAISLEDANLYNFTLVDYTDQSIRNYPFTLANYLGNVYNSEHYFYVVGYNNVSTFKLELSSTVQDIVTPPTQPEITISPNPFPASCKIQVKSDRSAPAKIQIYNLKGQFVKSLYEDTLSKGLNTFTWDGMNYANGIYILKLEMDGSTYSRRMILSK